MFPLNPRFYYMCGYFVAADAQQGFGALEFNTYLPLRSYRSSVRTPCALHRSLQAEFIYFRASRKQSPLFLRFPFRKALGVRCLIKETVNVLWPGVGLLFRQSLGTQRGFSSVYGKLCWIIRSRLDKVPWKHRCRINYQRKLTRCFGSACDTPHEQWNSENETKYKGSLTVLQMHTQICTECVHAHNHTNSLLKSFVTDFLYGVCSLQEVLLFIAVVSFLQKRCKNIML